MGLWGDVTGVLDDAGRSTDEALGRQFDGEQGGGFADPDTYTDDPALIGRLSDLQSQIQEPWTLLPGATLVNPDNRVGYVDGENVGDMYDVDQAVANLAGVGSGFDYLRSQTPDSGAPSDEPPSGGAHWLIKWLIDNWQTALAGVVVLYVLNVVGPVLDLLANATEGGA